MPILCYIALNTILLFTLVFYVSQSNLNPTEEEEEGEWCIDDRSCFVEFQNQNKIRYYNFFDLKSTKRSNVFHL